MNKKVDVIIPVYRGLEETIECIKSVANNLPEWADIIVVNDCSPELELSTWLRENCEEFRFSLYENDFNLGFVATVNFAMSLNSERDVLLLNSDVEVANDWLERMFEVAYLDSQIGSVTPFSNNATICSFPNFCEDNDLAMGKSLQEIDKVCSLANGSKDFVEVPTGVGFCMFIKRMCLDEVGLFDVDTFGKGYGEENDWCQRALALGWKSIHATNVFVYHKGGVSFADEQNPRQKTALELLLKKHPNYTLDVMKFINTDPAKWYRIRLAIELVRNSKKKVLQIEHSLGGGVSRHLNDLVKHIEPQAVSVRLSQKNSIVNVVLYENLNVEFNIDSDFNDLLSLLKYLSFSVVHFHHIHGLNKRLLNLPCDLSLDYIISVHDYYLINGNPALSDRSGKFFGDDDVYKVIEKSKSNQLAGFNYHNDIDLRIIRKFIKGANTLIFPSNDTQSRFCRFYNVKEKSLVVPHVEPYYNSWRASAMENNNDFNVKVLVIGAISLEKGALILNEFSENYGHVCEVHLLGSSCAPLSSNIRNHGPYQEADLVRKIVTINPTVVWYSSQCAETYCYTLTPAMALGLPIVAPKLGAFLERLAVYENCILLDNYSNVSEVYKAVIRASKFCRNRGANGGEKLAENDFYKNTYLEMMKGNGESNISLNFDRIRIIAQRENKVRDIKDMLYSLLLLLYRSRFAGKILSIVPVHYLRVVKRRFFG